MSLAPGEPDGATPLTDDERDGLRREWRWIATRADLDLAEQTSITDGLMPHCAACTTAW